MLTSSFLVALCMSDYLCNARYVTWYTSIITCQMNFVNTAWAFMSLVQVLVSGEKGYDKESMWVCIILIKRSYASNFDF